MSQTAFQDRYPESFAHCFGCGPLNEHGFHLKSYWDGDDAVCRFTPPDYYTGGTTDHTYGGVIASVMDCHAAGTAAAAKAREMGHDSDGDPVPRFVTASLRVDYVAPTPVRTELEVRARIREVDGRKVWLDITLGAEGTVTAKGEALMIQLR